MKAVNVMTCNLVAAREGSTAGEIGTKLFMWRSSKIQT